MEKLVDLFRRIVSGSWVNGAIDTQYRLTVTGDVAEIVFMGSVSWVDWISNFMFWKVPYKDMPVKWRAHAGFLDSWKAVKDEIINGLHGCRCVKVYGYSRGAAIAVLAHEWFAFNGYAVETRVFGCPRAIACKPDSAMLERFKTLHVYNNKGDIVTMLPPKLFGYKDVGNIVRLGTGFRIPCAKWHLIPQYETELSK